MHSSHVLRILDGEVGCITSCGRAVVPRAAVLRLPREEADGCGAAEQLAALDYAQVVGPWLVQLQRHQGLVLVCGSPALDDDHRGLIGGGAGRRGVRGRLGLPNRALQLAVREGPVGSRPAATFLEAVEAAGAARRPPGQRARHHVGALLQVTVRCVAVVPMPKVVSGVAIQLATRSLLILRCTSSPRSVDHAHKAHHHQEGANHGDGNSHLPLCGQPGPLRGAPLGELLRRVGQLLAPGRGGSQATPRRIVSRDHLTRATPGRIGRSGALPPAIGGILLLLATRHQRRTGWRQRGLLAPAPPIHHSHGALRGTASGSCGAP
mmetsp:Transcript_73755/g.216448  ORF Transcript_73755/g.216448 Transcript_73755/m.216448 type:complete len:322 (-) Transcript_73755:105-1070(-)